LDYKGRLVVDLSVADAPLDGRYVPLYTLSAAKVNNIRHADSRRPAPILYLSRKLLRQILQYLVGEINISNESDEHTTFIVPLKQPPTGRVYIPTPRLTKNNPSFELGCPNVKKPVPYVRMNTQPSAASNFRLFEGTMPYRKRPNQKYRKMLYKYIQEAGGK
jgi:hypothetical protein